MPHASTATRFAEVVAVAVRMLDNVLDATAGRCRSSSARPPAKRRIGLGFTGLGDALIMLGLRYDSDEARAAAADARPDDARRRLPRFSVELAREKGAFPLFDAERYLAAGASPRACPRTIKAAIRAHGIRNSHLLSIAPTGTISLAFADNASNGIEPAFSWFYTPQEAHGRRHDARSTGSRTTPGGSGAPAAATATKLPAAFVSALEHQRARPHADEAAVQPFVDTAIRKTVNVPEDYPFDAFEDLYLEAWQAGLKGITTYRPNNVLGAVLSRRTRRRGAAGSRPVRARPAHPHLRRAAAGAREPALAAPARARRTASRPGPTW